MSGRRPKTLLERVFERSFVPHRHGHLLASDRSLDRLELDDDDGGALKAAWLLPLYDIALWYRWVARSDRDRREAALAFRDVISGDFRRYAELIGPQPVRWVEHPDGSWTLERCPCDNCAAGVEPCLLGERLDMRGLALLEAARSG